MRDRVAQRPRKHVCFCFFSLKDVATLQDPQTNRPTKQTINLIGSHPQQVVPCLSPSFWWLHTILGVSWQSLTVDTALTSLPVITQHSSPCVCLCLGVSPLIRTLVIGFGAHPSPVRPHSYLTNYICKDNFLMQSHSQVPCGHEF